MIYPSLCGVKMKNCSPVSRHRHRLPQAHNFSIIYLSHCTESDMKYRSPVGRHTDTGSPRHRTTTYSNIPVTLHGVGYEVPLPCGLAHRQRLPQAQNYSIIYLSHCTESDMKYRSPEGPHTDTGIPGTELLHNIPVALHGAGYEVLLPGGPTHRHSVAPPGT